MNRGDAKIKSGWVVHRSVGDQDPQKAERRQIEALKILLEWGRQVKADKKAIQRDQ